MLKRRLARKEHVALTTRKLATYYSIDFFCGDARILVDCHYGPEVASPKKAPRFSRVCTKNFRHPENND